MTSMAHLWMAGLLALALQPGAARAQAPPAEQPSAAPQVAVKWVEPEHAVYLEFTGPYWRVGRAFRQVRTYMLEHKLDGPLFIRYPGPSEQGAAAADEAVMEVGFICPDAHEPSGPFRQATWKRQPVAFVEIEGVLRQTEPQQQLLETWAAAHGHRSLGTLTEIYHPAPVHASDGGPRTEIRLALAEPDAAPANAPRGKPVKAQPGKPTTEVPATPTEQAVEPAPTAPKRPVAKPVRPIAELLAEGEYEWIAEQVITPEQPWTPELRLWWNQAAFRLSAIADAVEQVTGKEDPAVSGLINAVTDRYHTVSRQAKVERPSQKIERAQDQPADPQRTARRRLLRDLDGLLGRITLKLASPQAVTEELAEFLEAAQQLAGTPQTGQTDAEPAAQPQARLDNGSARIGVEERHRRASCCKPLGPTHRCQLTQLNARQGVTVVGAAITDTREVLFSL